MLGRCVIHSVLGVCCIKYLPGAANIDEYNFACIHVIYILCSPNIPSKDYTNYDCEELDKQSQTKLTRVSLLISDEMNILI